MVSDIFNVRKQLTFYGAYHTNPVNVAIHILCVPCILWSFLVLAADIPNPSFLPHYSKVFNEHLIFESSVPTVIAGVYLAYYFVLEPVAALLYTPFMIGLVLTSPAFARRPDHLVEAGAVHAICWIAQFIGHGVAEGRAPALLDNLLGAVVLAPFFVHLEILFKLGYRPALHKDINNAVGVEVTRVRKLEGEKKRAAERKDL